MKLYAIIIKVARQPPRCYALETDLMKAYTKTREAAGDVDEGWIQINSYDFKRGQDEWIVVNEVMA